MWTGHFHSQYGLPQARQRSDCAAARRSGVPARSAVAEISAEAGGLVYFAAAGSLENELWVTNGTPAGTRETKEFPGPALASAGAVAAGPRWSSERGEAPLRPRSHSSVQTEARLQRTVRGPACNRNRGP